MNFGDGLTNQMKWQSVRGFRDRLLCESDWTQLSDSTANKDEWIAYRNALRNIPQDFSSPEEVNFPSRPE